MASARVIPSPLRPRPYKRPHPSTMSRQRPKSDKPSSQGWRGKQRRAPEGRGPRRGGDSDAIVLFGLHAVEAALANPKRELVKLIATEHTAERLAPLIAKRGVRVEHATPRDLDRLLGADQVHQGIALEVEQLPPVWLDEADPTASSSCSIRSPTRIMSAPCCALPPRSARQAWF